MTYSEVGAPPSCTLRAQDRNSKVEMWKYTNNIKRQKEQTWIPDDKIQEV